MPNIFRHLLSLFFVLSGVAFAQTAVPAAAIAPASPPSAPAAAAPLKAEETLITTVPDRIIRGNDQVLAPPIPRGVPEGLTSGLQFENAPLADVVSLVMREIAKVSYVIHPPVNGSVTMATLGAVSADQAVLLLEAALQANGVQMARDTRGVYHIGRPESLKGIVPAIRQGGAGPLPPGFGAVVIPLKFMGANEMASILRPLAPPDAIVRIDTVRNLLVMVGNRTQAEGWLDIVATFDIDLLKGMSVGVFALKNITTREVELALRLLNGGGAATPAPSTASPSGGAPAIGSVNSQLAAGSPFYGALRVIPIERINSVMVVTPRAAYLDDVRRWIEKLDQPGGNSPEAQLFVYPVQNGNAKHLADVLNGLFGNTAPTTASTVAANSNNGVAPGLAASTTMSTGFAGAVANNASASGNQAGGSSIKGSGLTSVVLNTGLRVIADEINNAVLVYGTRDEFEKIKLTLKRLDVPPTQVMIEASIIEVTLTDDLKYGLQWIFNAHSDNNNGLKATGVLGTLAGAAFGATPAGFSYTLRNTAGGVRAVINALADKSLVKVISSPSLMVLDNHTANIAVGNQQPINSGQTITAGGNVSSNIVYKDTGVSLAVTPSVSASDVVTMQVSQAVTDVGPVDVATGQRSFLQRQFSSKVAIQSGEALVLGGLIRDNTTSGKTGVPLLQDLPLIGSLFGATAQNTNRTELLVVITPRVVRTPQDLRQIGQELKDRMKSLYRAGPAPNDAGPLTQ